MPRYLSSNFYQEYHVDVWVLWDPVTKSAIHAHHVDQKTLWAQAGALLGNPPLTKSQIQRLGYRIQKARLTIPIGLHIMYEPTYPLPPEEPS